MKIKAIVYPAEEGGYWAEVPVLPDCFTDGETMEEVVANLQDTITRLARGCKQSPTNGAIITIQNRS